MFIRKLCFKKKQYALYKDTPDKLILFSVRSIHVPKLPTCYQLPQRKAERIGTISHDYDGYNIDDPIGKGGFAKVYKHIKSHNEGTFAVKEEPRAVSTFI